MPHSASAKKRHRQNLRNRDRNRVAKSGIKSSIRKVLEAIATGNVELAREEFRGASKTADKAASVGTIHRNRAARIKSRLSARVLAAAKGEAAPETKGRKTVKS